MNTQHITAPPQSLRYSLIVVWIWTGITSLLEWDGQSTQLLHEAGVMSPTWNAWLIGSGAALDLIIGLWIWVRPSRAAYLAALLAMAGMTLTGTFLLPGLWLHPLGPLLKNIPIAAALWWLMSDTTPAPPFSTRTREVS